MRLPTTLLLAFVLLLLLLGCSKKEPAIETPASICDAAKAKALVDDCKINKANPNDRDFVLNVKGELAAAITVQQLASEEAMEKTFLANQKEVAALGTEKKDDFTELRKDRKRRLVITGGSLAHATEVKPRFDQVIAFIHPEP